jgi:uncharacterized BrkB/YihY/UPF0761 family membrane protein
LSSLPASLCSSNDFEIGSSYNRTYGSLGAVIAFMTWMWLSATVVLVGAAIDAETERQAVPDSGNRLPNRGTMGHVARAPN